MSTATSHDHHNSQLLPPSPPPSPPSTRRRQRKRHDSFEKLANTPIPSPPGSPTHGPVADDEEDSSLRKIILTPFLFISFILSLSFVNLRDRAHRTYAHSNTSLLTYLYPSSWWDAEPYQDPDDSRWGMRGTASHVGPDDAISPSQGGQSEGGKKKKKTWHLNKKIRKVVKLEVSDAFEMSGKVMLGMCVMLVVGSIVFWMAAKWMLATMTGMLS
ncbi:hypothetical protein HBI40_062480 [Parastagonospora nodorum]|nr:hypothetical protein HBI41_148170 [Parastagonospora nodorum]KAH6295598.1 hypothetical protein HBI40_062480 [Parastagonospora nodorum]